MSARFSRIPPVLLFLLLGVAGLDAATLFLMDPPAARASLPECNGISMPLAPNGEAWTCCANKEWYDANDPTKKCCPVDTPCGCSGVFNPATECCCNKQIFSN
jgi:hypothetical protein